MTLQEKNKKQTGDNSDTETKPVSNGTDTQAVPKASQETPDEANENNLESNSSEVVTNTDDTRTVTLAPAFRRVYTFITDFAIGIVMYFFLSFFMGIFIGLFVDIEVQSVSVYQDRLDSANTFGDMASAYIDYFSDNFILLMSSIATMLLTVFVAFVLIPSKVTRGQTIGMSIFNIRILSINGKDINFSQALRRSTILFIMLTLVFVPIINFFAYCTVPIIILVDLIKSSSDQNMQTFSDKLAGTILVDGK